MDFTLLEYLTVLAREGSLSRAAACFFISPSALSQQLSRLEKQLGLTLFIRGRRGLTPTPAGELLLDYAGRMLQLRDEALESLKPLAEQEKNTLTVAAAPGRSPRLFARVYGEFARLRPECSLTLAELPSSEAERQLLQGQVKLCFSLLTPAEEAEAPFSYAVLAREPLVLMCAGSHPLLDRAKELQRSGNASAGALLSLFRDEPFILPARSTKLRRYIDGICQERGLALSQAFQVSSSADIGLSLGEGRLCGLASRGFLPEDRQQLAVLELGPEYCLDYVLLWKKDRRLSAPEQDFIRLCKAKA